MTTHRSPNLARIAAVVLAGALATVIAVSCNGLSDTPGNEPFDENGRLATRIGTSSLARAVVLQPDGKIVAAGSAHNGQYYDFVVARYQPDGSLDPGFGNEGIVVTGFGTDVWLNSAALARDGSLIVAGERRLSPETEVLLARYSPDGSLDTAFGTDGKVATLGVDGTSMVLQEDGRIVVVGDREEEILLLRFNQDGSPDAAFGDGGRATIARGHKFGPARDVAVQPDGKLVVLGKTGDVINGFDPMLVRVNADGSLDTTFGNAGTVVTPRSEADFVPGQVEMVLEDGTTAQFVNKRGEAIEIQADGKIVVAGWRGASDAIDFMLLRYNPDGSPDLDFGERGTVYTDIDGAVDHGYDLVLLPEGKIAVAGDTSSGTVGSGRIVIARYLPDGAADLSFDQDGIAVVGSADRAGDSAHAISVKPDGTIVVAGNNTRQVLGGGIASQMVVAQYADGALE